MSERKINLEEILTSFGIEDDSTHPNQDKRDLYLRQKSILLDFGRQLLELAAENAHNEDRLSYHTGEPKRIIQSILDTINQVE